jgi:hypothetical protein
MRILNFGYTEYLYNHFSKYLNNYPRCVNIGCLSSLRKDPIRLQRSSSLDKFNLFKIAIYHPLSLRMANTPLQSTVQPSMLNLPDGLSPDSIDTLPVLSAILSRLQTLSASGGTTSGSPPEASPSQLANGAGSLSIKDIPAATDEMKHKLQKARAQVKELPDISRSLVEQEEEIEELEEKIRRQREVLQGLREVGLATKKEMVAREKAQITEDVVT